MPVVYVTGASILLASQPEMSLLGLKTRNDSFFIMNDAFNIAQRHYCGGVREYSSELPTGVLFQWARFQTWCLNDSEGANSMQHGGS